MKTYNFTVTTNFGDNSTGFMQELLGEIDNEKQQLELTHKVNRETSKQHAIILKDFIEPINEQLDEIGLEFTKVDMPSTAGANKYSIHRYEVNINSMHMVEKTFDIEIVPKLDADFTHSKYTTYTGAHNVEINGKVIGTPGDALDRMRSTIKRFITND